MLEKSNFIKSNFQVSFTNQNMGPDITCSGQGNLTQGKAQLALKNWKNLFGDQSEDSLTI